MRFYLLITCLFFAPLLSNGGAAAPPYPGVDTSFTLPACLNEKVEVIIDREIYGVGERIRFAGINISSPELNDSCWSKVLYLELLTPGGTSVAQGKFPLSCTRASGYLNIPEDLLTGNYYLVAYTKWMRNFSPINFHYQLIKIINPFTPQLETSHSSNGIGQIRKWEQKPLKESISCNTDKVSYRQREKINLMINVPVSSRSLTNTYTVTVVRKGSPDTLSNLTILPDEIQYQRHPETIYLPESRGLSLSGRLVPGDSSGSVPNDNVNLAILGQEPVFRVIRSGPGGTFFFELDSMVGRNDMYIASNHEKKDLEIRIDNDFANPVVRFPEIPFILSESENKLAEKIIFNMQISSHFSSPDTMISETEKKGEDPQIISFYGLPSASVLIDDYIDLPTLKEVLIELVPGVFPRVQNKQPYLSFNGNKLTFTLINNYSPLLLVDQVPVSDLAGLLLMSPKKIHRVDVLNEIYIIGNATYGGILNVITKKGDMGGIDLPENSFFFEFTSFMPPDELDFPRYGDQEFDSENPDYRNCLYWTPDVEIDPGKEVALDFFSSDDSGEYMVLIRGVGKDGTILQGKCYFQVE